MKTLSPSLPAYEGLGQKVTTIFTTFEEDFIPEYAHCWDTVD